MIDLGNEIETSVRADWTEQRRQAAYAGLGLRRRRKIVARIALGAIVTVCLLASASLVWTQGGSGPAQPIALRNAEPSTTLRFGDGSTVTPAGIESRVRTVSVAAGRVVVELERGGGRFEIVEDRTRVFRVSSSRVTIEAFGAVFACSQLGQQTRIEVFRGTLRVFWSDQKRELTAGETDVLPPTTPVNETAPVHEPARIPAHPPARVVKDSWRDLARDGDYDRAYTALAHADAPVRDEPEELLLLADVKRLSHHPAEAIEPLRQIVRDHAGDPRASLAAFTLGRVLSNQTSSTATGTTSSAHVRRRVDQLTCSSPGP